ncbi:hypothetical protein CRYUN_Cryun10bG0117400 [Craigia yunnanensis]
MKLGIPRLVFHGTSYFAICVFYRLLRYEPQKNVTSDYEPFELPGIPDKKQMTRQQQPDELRERLDDEIKKLMYQALESEITSYGVIMNSFQELEPAYVEHYRKVMERKDGTYARYLSATGTRRINHKEEMHIDVYF